MTQYETLKFLEQRRYHLPFRLVSVLLGVWGPVMGRYVPPMPCLAVGGVGGLRVVPLIRVPCILQDNRGNDAMVALMSTRALPCIT